MNNNLTVVVPDMHFPFQDQAAVDVVIKTVELLKPARVVQLGDIVDCAVFSVHGPNDIRDVRADSFLTQEIAPARKFIDQMLKHCKLYVQMAGNHEYRVDRWALRQGPVGLAVHDLVSPEYLLGAGRTKAEFQWVPYTNTASPTSYYSITEHLIAVHGWSFAKNAAQVHLDKARTRSIIYGHTHRYQTASTRDPFSHEVLKAFSPGTLSVLQPLYFTGGSPTDWVHGFSLIYTSRNKQKFSEYCVTIDNGSCVLPDSRQIVV
jgi:predicted phosphodiesterase